MLSTFSQYYTARRAVSFFPLQDEMARPPALYTRPACVPRVPRRLPLTTHDAVAIPVCASIHAWNLATPWSVDNTGLAAPRRRTKTSSVSST